MSTPRTKSREPLLSAPSRSSSPGTERGRFHHIIRFFEQKRRQAGCVAVFISVLAALMVDRAVFFSLLNEASGWRQVTYVGIMLARPTAAALTVLYPVLLIPLARNMLSKLRQSWLNAYIPFDSAIEFHKLAAKLGVGLTVVHIIGHMINFYTLSKQPVEVMSCLMPGDIRSNGQDKPLSMLGLMFGTLPGLTGFFLVVIMSIIYVFATTRTRRNQHRMFWKTHMLYPLFFVLLCLHGLGGLLQAPRFYYVFGLPALIFLLDHLITWRRSKVEVYVEGFKLLQSNVLELRMDKPHSFHYKSGMWFRIACKELR